MNVASDQREVPAPEPRAAWEAGRRAARVASSDRGSPGTVGGSRQSRGGDHRHGDERRCHPGAAALGTGGVWRWPDGCFFWVQ